MEQEKEDLQKMLKEIIKQSKENLVSKTIVTNKAKAILVAVDECWFDECMKQEDDNKKLAVSKGYIEDLFNIKII